MNLIPCINNAYDDDEAGLNHESTKSPLFYNVYLIAQLPLLDIREVTLFIICLFFFLYYCYKLQFS